MGKTYVPYISGIPDSGITSTDSYAVLNINGIDTKVLLVTGVISKMDDDTYKYYGINTLLLKQEFFGILKEKGILPDVNGFVYKNPFLVYKVISLDSMPLHFINVTPIYKMLSNPEFQDKVESSISSLSSEEKDAYIEKIVTTLDSAVTKANRVPISDFVTKENLFGLSKFFGEMGEVSRGDSDKTVVVPEIFINPEDLEAYNSKRRKVKSFSYVTSKERKQVTPTSELWFSLPPEAVLKAGDPANMVPSASFGNHYPSSLFSSPLYMEYVNGNFNSPDDFIYWCKSNVNSLTKKTMFDGFTIEDEVAFIEHDLYEVIGNEANNELPIQDFEMNIKQNLVNLVKSSIVDLITSTGTEATDELVEEYYNEGRFPDYSIRYLTALLEYFLRANWAHSGKVPSLHIANDSDDFDEEETDQDALIYSTSPTANLMDFEPFDAVEVLSQVLWDNSRKMSCDIFIDAIIRIARWGSMKPSKVYIGNDSYINLNTLGISKAEKKEEDTVDLSSGNLFHLVAPITLKFNDTEGLGSVYSVGGSKFDGVVGFLVEIRTSGKSKLYSFAMDEIYLMLTDESYKEEIYGMLNVDDHSVAPFDFISYSDGEFTFSESIYSAPTQTLAEVIDYGSNVASVISKNLMTLCLKFRINSSVSTLSSILKFAKESDLKRSKESYNYDTEKDLTARILNGTPPMICLQFKLFNSAFECMAEVFTEGKSYEESIPKLFGSYKEKYKDGLLLGDDREQATVQSSVFAKTDEKKEEGGLCVDKNILAPSGKLDGDLAMLKYSKVVRVDKGDGKGAVDQLQENVIGILSMKKEASGVKYHITLNDSETQAVLESAKTGGKTLKHINLNKVRPLIMRNMFAGMETGEVKAFSYDSYETFRKLLTEEGL